MTKLNTIIRSIGLSAALMTAATAFATDITGAGATFPYPIYAKWAEAYKAKTGAGMNYQSIGSGGGIKQINAKTVDFGAPRFSTMKAGRCKASRANSSVPLRFLRCRSASATTLTATATTPRITSAFRTSGATAISRCSLPAADS